MSPAYPGAPLRIGSSGDSVALMQRYLNRLATVHPTIPTIATDGIFGSNTQSAVIAFQRLFGLTADGVIGPATWAAIVREYGNIGGSYSAQMREDSNAVEAYSAQTRDNGNAGIGLSQAARMLLLRRMFGGF